MGVFSKYKFMKSLRAASLDWVIVTSICDELLPNRRQAITWSNDDLPMTGALASTLPCYVDMHRTGHAACDMATIGDRASAGTVIA